ncbi:MAG: aconitase/3-isopropylmalate dehydratase large subunit family protein [Candidatus Hodarchaeales archaeon]
MKGQTFSEKIFSNKIGKKVQIGEIVFAEPDWILSHDNTASIQKTFKKMGGQNVKNPDRLVIVLDHDAPPTDSTLANDHKSIRLFVKNQGIRNFHDVGDGICHQLMANHVLPGQLVVGSDSHTSTSGAFTTFSAGIDRTETAGLWLSGKTWFRVPESIKIVLHGKLPLGVYAKDIALWLMGTITSSGANYQAIEFHGDGISNLSISERMTVTTLASEMGAKTAIFPPDEVLKEWLEKNDIDNSLDLIESAEKLWADNNASYTQKIEIDLEKLVPLIAIPHHVDNVKAITDIEETSIQEAFLGTCTNARLDDLNIAASIVKGKKIKAGVQFLIAPSSRSVFLEAMEKGAIQSLVESGATILPSSCGPCLGKGQGIPADDWNVISTANRNFLGRMGNKYASIFLASPATIAASALEGKIVDPREIISGSKAITKDDSLISKTKSKEKTSSIFVIPSNEDRYSDKIWYYGDVDNFNTDLMFAGTLTYNIKSSNPKQIIPNLFKGLDETFASRAKKDDILIAGENFGCGSSREHPAVGLAYIGVKAVIVKSVSRIFYRSAVNQGLPIIVHPVFVENYKQGEFVEVNLTEGKINTIKENYTFPKLPNEIMAIFQAGGLINYYNKTFR